MNQDDRLGPYRLLRRLGEGGMGVVHLGVDPQGRQVAVKVLRAEVAGDDVARRRLSREVETMRRVRNRHIAEVVDADVTGHRPYIVTRYVPGRPLDDLVKQDGPLDEEALIRVGYGVADALAAVHAAGVIHRDLKPGNVMMLDGSPVLIDFGIAQAVDATRLTQTGMFIGTPGYLAPEIIEGQDAGPEVDVHAWAGTLIYAATGKPPFGKGTLEMIFFNITAGRANVDGAPESLRPILRAALSRDPAQRPTAAELVRRMAELLPAPAGSAAPARPRVPDEVTTVPNLPAAGGAPAPGPQPGPPQPQPLPAQPLPAQPRTPGPAAPVPRQGGQPAAHPEAPPTVPAPAVSAGAGRQDEFVSLLEPGPKPADPGEGDPFPTVRVTDKGLRSAGVLRDSVPPRQAAPAPAPPAPPAAGIPVTGAHVSDFAGAQGPPAAAPAPGYGAGANEGDIPTRRVRPGELAGLAGVVRPSSPVGGGLAQPPRDDAFEQTPHRRTPNPVPSLPGAGAAAQPWPQASPPQPPQPLQAAQPPQPVQPVPPTPVPSAPPRAAAPASSRVYGLVSALLLLAVVALAVRAPVPVFLLALPATVLLRAADMAQPLLHERRPATAAAGDVVKVLTLPGPLLKSLVYTAGLFLYGAILGLPVTLFLTVFVPAVSTSTALSWGLAVALWTVCAGPGVDGPRRQMRRMLASMFPSRSTAMTMAGVIGLVAAAATLFAVATFFARSQQTWWQPLDAAAPIELLDGLRQRAQAQ